MAPVIDPGYGAVTAMRASFCRKRLGASVAIFSRDPFEHGLDLSLRNLRRSQLYVEHTIVRRCELSPWNGFVTCKAPGNSLDVLRVALEVNAKMSRSWSGPYLLVPGASLRLVLFAFALAFSEHFWLSTGARLEHEASVECWRICLNARKYCHG